MNYPLPVEKEVEQMMEKLQDALSMSEDIGETELRESFSRRIFERFVSGDELELSKDEIEDSIDEASINTTYNGLVEKGFLDFYQTEDGEKHYFLTDLGKELAKELIKRKEHEI